MSLLDGLRHRFRVWFNRRDFDAGMDQELDFHLELEAMQERHAGAGEDDARRSARRRLGNLTHVREEIRRATEREWWDSFVADVRFAVRSLRREPMAAGFIVLTLGLGIGANAAMYGIAERLLLRGPEHVRDVGSIVRLYLTGFPDEFRGMYGHAYPYVPYTDYEVMRRESRSFSAIAIVGFETVSIGTGAEAQTLNAQPTTASLFPLLGVRPAIGRFWTEEEDDPDRSPPVAVLAHGTWRRVFGGDSSIVGKTVRLDGRETHIIGVAPPRFTGSGLGRLDLWMPVGVALAARSPQWRTNGNRVHQLIARLRPGVSIEQASADAQAVNLAHLLDRSPIFAKSTRVVAPLMSEGPGRLRRDVVHAGWLAAVTALVLLIACANVTNLLLARGVRRRSEVAVRLALGAGRGRLIRLFLIEAVLLATAGGALALVVAHVVGSTLRSMLLGHVEWVASPLAGGVPLAIMVLALTVGILVGIIPAVRASATNLTASLKSGARSVTPRSSLRTALTIAQTATSVVLLVGAGLFLRSVWTARTLDLGLDPERVLVVDVGWAGSPRTAEERLSEKSRRNDLLVQSLDRVRRLPGVERASLGSGTPFLDATGAQISIPGRDSLHVPPGVEGPEVTAVGTDYFETMGTRILRGRGFTADDRAGSEPVMVISELMARTLWPGVDALGQCAVTRRLSGAPCARIVGIAADTYRMGLREEERTMRVYLSHAQAPQLLEARLLVRSARPASVIAPVRSALVALDPTLASIRAETIQSRVIDDMTRTWRTAAMVLSMGGVLAIVVAAVGMFSVMSYLVAQRTQEIGVRVALGARPAQIVGLVARHSGLTVLVGLAIGIGAAIAGGGLVEPALFETSGRDPVVLAGVVGMLLLVAAAASVAPTRSALRVDPIDALRSE